MIYQHKIESLDFTDLQEVKEQVTGAITHKDCGGISCRICVFKKDFLFEVPRDYCLIMEDDEKKRIILLKLALKRIEKELERRNDT